MRAASDQDDRRELVVSPETAIPLSELEWTFSGSSGPGGQHVNRRATRVTVRFDVARSPSLGEEQRALLLDRLANRLDGDGVLQIHVDERRSQSRNRAIAIERLELMLARALRPRKPRRSTRPTAASIRRRLEDKRRRSERKAGRRSPNEPTDQPT